MEQEIWKDIPGYPEVQASSFGRIRSLRILKPVVTQGTGYPAVGTAGQQRTHVHYLVALAFHGPRPEGKEVNHKDSNRANPRPENLEYLTPEENSKHATIASGRVRFTPEEQKVIEDFYYIEGVSVLEIARRMDCHRNAIRSMLATWAAPKGRRGAYQRKITSDMKEKIRRLYAAGEVTQGQLGKMFNLDSSGICRIVKTSS